MTLTEKLDRIPPCVARILAKKDRRLATDQDLVRITGWSMIKVRWVYQRRSWAGIKVADVDTFLSACDLNWSSQREKRWLLRLAMERGGIGTMQHLQRRKMSHQTSWLPSQLARHLRRIEKILSQ